MYLTEEQKLAIASEYTSFVDSMYAGKTKKERQELDQFFTPAELTIKMLDFQLVKVYKITFMNF